MSENASTSSRGFKIIVERVPETDIDSLKALVDQLRVKIGSGIVALAASQGDSAIMVAGITADLAKTLNAGQLIKEANLITGGKGGGRADFAQAGGLNPDKIEAGLQKLFELVS